MRQAKKLTTPHAKCLLYATYWVRPILAELLGAAREDPTSNKNRAPSGPVKAMVSPTPHSRQMPGHRHQSGVSLIAWFPASWAGQIACRFLRDTVNPHQHVNEVEGERGATQSDGLFLLFGLLTSRPRGWVGIAALLCPWQTAGGGSILRWSASKTQADRTVPHSINGRRAKKNKCCSVCWQPCSLRWRILSQCDPGGAWGHYPIWDEYYPNVGERMPQCALLTSPQNTVCFVRGICKAVCMTMPSASTGGVGADTCSRPSRSTCLPLLVASSFPGQQSTSHSSQLTSNGQTWNFPTVHSKSLSNLLRWHVKEAKKTIGTAWRSSRMQPPAVYVLDTTYHVLLREDKQYCGGTPMLEGIPYRLEKMCFFKNECCIC